MWASFIALLFLVLNCNALGGSVEKHGTSWNCTQYGCEHCKNVDIKLFHKTILDKELCLNITAKPEEIDVSVNLGAKHVITIPVHNDTGACFNVKLLKLCLVVNDLKQNDDGVCGCLGVEGEILGFKKTFDFGCFHMGHNPECTISRPPPGAVANTPRRPTPSHCVHAVPAGSSFEVLPDGRLAVTAAGGYRRQFDRCSDPQTGRPLVVPLYGHGPAWKAWAQFENTSVLSTVTGKWTVPPNPSVSLGPDQILYFWNGIEPKDNSAVLQPVLQFGATPAGGGQFWAVASWYVSSAHGSFFSPLTKCSPGDVIDGIMTLDANGKWVVDSRVNGQQTGSHFAYKPASTSYDFAYEVLEAYGIESAADCNIYPSTGKVPFNNITVASGGIVLPNVQWTTKTKDTICGEHAVAESSSHVTIFFDNNGK